MIMPKLFYKQYLCLSPIWLAYQMKKNISTQSFLLHYKLLSAYAIMQKPNIPKCIEQILTNSKQIQIMQNQSVCRARAYLGYPIQKQYQYSQIASSQQWIDCQYLQKIKQLHNKKIDTLQYRQAKINLLHKFVIKSYRKQTDQLDLLIISLLEHDQQSLGKLGQAENLIWTKTAHNKIQQNIMRILGNGWNDIYALRKILKLHANNPMYTQLQLLKNIYLLVSNNILKDNSKAYSQLSTLEKSFRSRNTDIIQNMKEKLSQSQRDIFVKQYCIYINWLVIKTLLSTNPHNFLTSFQDFINIIFMQFRNKNNEDKYMYIDFVKLELITSLYQTICNSNPNKISQLSEAYSSANKFNKTKSRNLINDLKNLKNKWEKICNPKNQLVNHKCSLFQQVLVITGNLETQICRKYAKNSVSQLLKTPIIAIEIQQLFSAYKLSKILEMTTQFNKINKFLQTKKVYSQLLKDQTYKFNLLKKLFILNNKQQILNKEVRIYLEQCAFLLRDKSIFKNQIKNSNVKEIIQYFGLEIK